MFLLVISRYYMMIIDNDIGKPIFKDCEAFLILYRFVDRVVKLIFHNSGSNNIKRYKILLKIKWFVFLNFLKYVPPI